MCQLLLIFSCLWLSMINIAAGYAHNKQLRMEETSDISHFHPSVSAVESLLNLSDNHDLRKILSSITPEFASISADTTSSSTSVANPSAYIVVKEQLTESCSSTAIAYTAIGSSVCIPLPANDVTTIPLWGVFSTQGQILPACPTAPTLTPVTSPTTSPTPRPTHRPTLAPNTNCAAEQSLLISLDVYSSSTCSTLLGSATLAAPTTCSASAPFATSYVYGQPNWGSSTIYLK